MNEVSLLKDIMPGLADELRHLLLSDDLQDLANQIDSLLVFDRCRCEDDFCASFYTKPKPDSAYGKGHSNIALNPDSGTIILDVVDGVIVHVEVLYRDEIRDQLNGIFP